jgi:asparagine synthase (glutamine-hydrolysing)
LAESKPVFRHLKTEPGPGFARTPAITGLPDDLAVDADACSCEGNPLVTLDDWRSVVRDRRLGDVDGSFALAWRDAEGRVSLARDAIGHRSLYYSLQGGRLAFGSSVRALLDGAPGPRRVDLHALGADLACAYVPGRATLVEGVHEVLPGEIVSFHAGELTHRRSWELPSDPARFDDEATLRTRLRSALERTVSSALPPGEAVAASLSGGIDSSLIVALAARLSPAPVQSFSITFGKQHADELEWSSLVAKHTQTEHTIVEITPAAVLAHLDHTVACLDKPNGDPLTVPNALLFRAMAERSSVALNGEGGDPCFGGPKNLPMLLSALYGHGEDPDDGQSLERNYLRAHLKCFDELPDLLTKETLERARVPDLERELTPWFTDDRWKGLVSKLMAINTRFKGGHHILPKVAALSAPFGIRARSPLFAKPLVELAFAIPPELKLRGSDEKYLLKQSVADLLPRAILERPKSGMLVPVEAWFQGPLLPEARARILDGLAPLGLFARPYLEKLVGGKLGGLRPRRGVKIWLLVTLEAHLRALGVSA